MLVNCVLGKLIVITGSRKLHRDSQSYCESVIEGTGNLQKQTPYFLRGGATRTSRGPGTEQTRETLYGSRVITITLLN